MRALRQFIPVAALALAALSQAPNAEAEMMVGGSTNMVFGSQTFTTSFNTPSAGTVSIALTNIDWPQKLSSLSAYASTATDMLTSTFDFAPLSADGESPLTTLTFDVGGAGTYFAHVSATASTDPSALGLGLFSMKIEFSPVPLPAAFWLLSTGAAGVLFCLPGVRRRRALLPLATA